VSDWVTVMREHDIAPGEWRTAELDGTAIAVFNLAGTYYAIADVCTHDAGQLTGGAVEGDEIVCPRHGARFCIRTGAALTPPAYEATDSFPVRVEGGDVQVRDARWDEPPVQARGNGTNTR
jgi:3-phenylpropionate/trans-cinnamate dioxygenase ferredoxin subunit